MRGGAKETRHSRRVRGLISSRMRKENLVDLYESLAAAGEQAGAIWTLEQSAELNANLVRFPGGEEA